ncbi:MAG: heavy-metal-associated domain-containing protein [Chloroflexi bacterium]|nr:heavy-metal-associated domain-containing protein [Chloroflexota bacterium]
MANTQSAEIKILDGAIHCDSCVARIKSVVSKIPGVAEVSASESDQTVSVTFHPDRVSVDEVRRRLDDVGYATAD